MNDQLRNILLIEDCPVAQKVAKIVFSKLNCKLDTATSGHDGIKMALCKRYDCLIVDVGLPDISGMETVQQLLSQTDAYQGKVPIIALTAHNDTEYRNHCTEFGFTSYYCKPLTVDTAKTMLEIKP
ncbi:MAG: response regulator [Pseudomonadota bacterium]|nr:response regulator [Pseudomonadota bacterium]